MHNAHTYVAALPNSRLFSISFGQNKNITLFSSCLMMIILMQTMIDADNDCIIAILSYKSSKRFYREQIKNIFKTKLLNFHSTWNLTT